MLPLPLSNVYSVKVPSLRGRGGRAIKFQSHLKLDCYSLPRNVPCYHQLLIPSMFFPLLFGFFFSSLFISPLPSLYQQSTCLHWVFLILCWFYLAIFSLNGFLIISWYCKYIWHWGLIVWFLLALMYLFLHILNSCTDHILLIVLGLIPKNTFHSPLPGKWRRGVLLSWFFYFLFKFSL